jgi:hypothetical protein
MKERGKREDRRETQTRMEKTSLLHWQEHVEEGGLGSSRRAGASCRAEPKADVAKGGRADVRVGRSKSQEGGASTQGSQESVRCNKSGPLRLRLRVVVGAVKLHAFMT